MLAEILSTHLLNEVCPAGTDHPGYRFEDGPNGPLVPELKALFPDSPCIARPGNINAWDNEDFVNAVKATGKKQLLIAGIVTEVCVAFPALSGTKPVQFFRSHVICIEVDTF